MTRISTDGLWWGSGHHWQTTLSPDGRLRWDGGTWISTPTGAPPEVLEAMDPWSLATNRGKRLSLSQLLSLIVREEASLLTFPFRVPFDPGCAVAVPIVGFVLLLLWLVIWILGIPVVLLMCVVEMLIGLEVAEGPLATTQVKRRWSISVGSHDYQVPAKIAQVMRAGQHHRIFVTRLNPVVVNYERVAQ
jgi:hypothetical protein